MFPGEGSSTLDELAAHLAPSDVLPCHSSSVCHKETVDIDCHRGEERITSQNDTGEEKSTEEHKSQLLECGKYVQFTITLVLGNSQE